MSKRKVGGYIFNQEVVRAMNANETARQALRRLIDDRPGPQMQMMLVAKAATALGENLAALRELEIIGRNSK